MVFELACARCNRCNQTFHSSLHAGARAHIIEGMGRPVTSVTSGWECQRRENFRSNPSARALAFQCAGAEPIIPSDYDPAQDLLITLIGVSPERAHAA